MKATGFGDMGGIVPPVSSRTRMRGECECEYGDSVINNLRKLFTSPQTCASPPHTIGKLTSLPLPS